MDSVSLTIDGKCVQARKGEKLLWVALDAGIYIPNLCAIRQAEEPASCCRLCFVDIEGCPEPVTACTEEVAEGMVIQTRSLQLDRLRRTAFELLMASYSADCPSCVKHRHCELQKVAAYLRVGLKPRRFRKRSRQLPSDQSNPFFIRDPNRCILCGKCIWACSEIQGADAIDYSFRGFETIVNPFGGFPIIESRCETCGGCVAICPAGSLVAKDFRWPKGEVKTICPHCSVGCGIYLGLDKGRIVSVCGDGESPVNQGSLCAKGRFGIAEYVQHPQRLSTPLVRRNGKLVEASWDEALNTVAVELAKYKGEQFGLITSWDCTNEDAYVTQKFARAVMGTNNVDNTSRPCLAPSLEALSQSLGVGAMTNPISEVEEASCILAVGTNLTSSHPIVGQKVRRAARKGTKLIVVNPREIELCRHASLWLQPRPGTDLALLMGIMQIIVEEGLVDLAFIEKRCQNYEVFRQSLGEFDLESVESITGIPQQQVVEAARIYATSKATAILYGSGITQHHQGIDNVLALANLALLTGNVGKAHSGIYPLLGQNNTQGTNDMGALPDFLPGYQPLSESEVRKKFEVAWGCSLNRTPGLALVEMLRAASAGKIKALYVVGANPVETDAGNIRKALGGLSFLVVQDMFLSETAQMANLVLPAASFAEVDGTFTNLERRVQLVRKAIEPVGNSKPDWWIICQIAKKMGMHGFDYEHPSQIMAEIACLIPNYGGISYQRLKRESLQWPCPTNDHPGTLILHSKASTRGKALFTPLTYQPPTVERDEDYPFVLITQRSLYETGNLSKRVEGLALLAGEELVELNPRDASSLGLADNEPVRVISRGGEATAKTRLTEALPPGTVCMRPDAAKRLQNAFEGSTSGPRDEIPVSKLCMVRLERIPDER